MKASQAEVEQLDSLLEGLLVCRALVNVGDPVLEALRGRAYATSVDGRLEAEEHLVVGCSL